MIVMRPIAQLLKEEVQQDEVDGDTVTLSHVPPQQKESGSCSC